MLVVMVVGCCRYCWGVALGQTDVSPLNAKEFATT